MGAKQRDAILGDPYSGALRAVLDAPPWLSGISAERQRQYRDEAIVRLHADRWAQQEIDGAAWTEINALVGASVV